MISNIFPKSCLMLSILGPLIQSVESRSLPADALFKRQGQCKRPEPPSFKGAVGSWDIPIRTIGKTFVGPPDDGYGQILAVVEVNTPGEDFKITFNGLPNIPRGQSWIIEPPQWLHDADQPENTPYVVQVDAGTICDAITYKYPSPKEYAFPPETAPFELLPVQNKY